MPYDKKTGKHYDYTKEGISQYKKDTGKGMPYTPFKMSGHTLPGPNQNSALKRLDTTSKINDLMNMNLPDWNAIMQHKRKVSGQQKVGESIEGNEQPQVTQDYVDTGMDDSNVDTLATEENTTKVPVDVEVTVNDKKI